MRRRKFARLASILLTLARSPLFCSPITIAVPVQQEGLETTRSWAMLCRQVQADSGIELRAVVMKDHRAALDELRRRFVDLALVDPAWYSENRRSLVPLLEARAVRHDASRVSLIVPRGSMSYRPADLAGRSIALTREGQSAAGYFVPLALLAEAGVVYADPKRLVFAETFDSIIKGVAFESLDAGAVPTHELDASAGRAYADFIRVIAQSDPIPHPLIVGRAEDGPARYGELIRAFIGLSGSERGRQALLSSGYAEFTFPAAIGFEALERYLRIYRDSYGDPE
jgi:ABC-type phosphate/phosphonate transport system substrate-binding protein